VPSSDVDADDIGDGVRLKRDNLDNIRIKLGAAAREDRQTGKLPGIQTIAAIENDLDAPPR
jgi:hypothetical protein